MACGVVTQFWQLDQDEVNADYADRYLDVVAAIAEQRDSWIRTWTDTVIG